MATTRGKGIAASAGIALFAAAATWAPGEPPVAISSNAVTGRPTADGAADVVIPEGSSRPGYADAAATTAEPPASTPARADRFHSRAPRDAAGRLEDRHVPWYRTGFGALAVVLALVGAAAYAVRRWMPTARPNDGRLLQVMARTSLSPKHSVVLLSLGRRFVLVGVSGDRMTALGEISDPQEVAELTLRAERDLPRIAGVFQGLLSREASGFGVAGATEAIGTGPASSADGVDIDAPAGVDSECVGTGWKGATLMKHDRRSVREPLSDLLRRLRALQSDQASHGR